MSLFAMTYILYTMYVVSAGGPIVLECKGEEYQACPMSYQLHEAYDTLAVGSHSLIARHVDAQRLLLPLVNTYTCR